MDITVQNKFVRISPRKVRPVLHSIRGQKAELAVNTLRFIRKEAATTLYQLLKSGIAAASENDIEVGSLVVKSVFCNEGPRLRRRRFESKGQPRRITKRMSHLVLTLTNEGSVVEPTVNVEAPVLPEENSQKKS